MIDGKQWYHSKTIWGSLIAVAAALAGSFGVAIDAQAQQSLVDAALQLVGAGGALFAIYGRLAATDLIR